MSKFIKICFDKYLTVSLQQPLKRLFIRPIWRLINYFNDMWLPIYWIDRSGLRVILIGHDVRDPYFINLIYSECLESVRIGTVPLWGLNAVMRRWEKNADFIIFRDRRFRPQGTEARRMLIMPYYVAQSIDLPSSDANLLATFANSTTRRDLKRIRDAGFQYEITQEPAQLDFFYQQMYRPTIQKRQCESVEIIPWEVFRQAYANMELLLIRKEGLPLPVAGNLNLQTDDCYTLHVNGTLNANSELLKMGGDAALYWFSMAEAHRRGCTTVNLGCSRPFLKDGVLLYKKKWGSHIVMDHREPELWLLPCGNYPPMHRFLEENPFICELDGRLVSLIFLGSHVILGDKDLSNYLKRCHFQGDCLSTLVVLLNREWAGRAETIENILSELPQSSRVLDLSEGSLTELPQLISNWQDLFVGSPTELAYSR